jgi:hypothetical protein
VRRQRALLAATRARSTPTVRAHHRSRLTRLTSTCHARLLPRRARRAIRDARRDARRCRDVGSSAIHTQRAIEA